MLYFRTSIKPSHLCQCPLTKVLINVLLIQYQCLLTVCYDKHLNIIFHLIKLLIYRHYYGCPQLHVWKYCLHCVHNKWTSSLKYTMPEIVNGRELLLVQKIFCSLPVVKFVDTFFTSHGLRRNGQCLSHRLQVPLQLNAFQVVFSRLFLHSFLLTVQKILVVIFVS